MRVFVRIAGIYESQEVTDASMTGCVDSRTFDELRQVAPEGIRDNLFRIQLSENDVRLAPILNIFERAGLNPKTNRHRTRSKNEYSLVKRREYDKNDLNAAILLCPNAPIVLGKRLPNGHIELSPKEIQKLLSTDLSVARTLHNNLIICKDLRDRILENNLGVNLSAVGNSIAGSDRNALLWEITSLKKLPPLASECKIVNRSGKPFGGDPDEGCYLVEPFFTDPILRYSADSIDGILDGGNDCFETQEHFGASQSEASSVLVVSQSLYQVLKDVSEIDWQPVSIDQEMG